MPFEFSPPYELTVFARRSLRYVDQVERAADGKPVVLDGRQIDTLLAIPI